MSKISKGEWLLLYLIAGILDLGQFIISFTGIGIVINEFADPIIGIVLLFYFQIRGVSIIRHPSRLLSLLGVAGLEIITGGIAPAWIVDIWYINRTVRKEQIDEEDINEQIISNMQRKPLYVDGIRQPINSEKQKQYIPGIRPPSRGLK